MSLLSVSWFLKIMHVQDDNSSSMSVLLLISLCCHRKGKNTDAHDCPLLSNDLTSILQDFKEFKSIQLKKGI